MEYGVYSHKGIHRKANEDSYYIPGCDDQAGPAMIMVADGMGGHNAGDTASRVTVDHVSSYFLSKYADIHNQDELLETIYQAIQIANNRVYDLSRTKVDLSGMGTTLTMAVFYEGHVHVAHIGDSRCYLLREGKARQITRDHSLVQELLDNGSITRAEVEMHPKKNVITRALGTEYRLKIDCFEEPVCEGDIVLLCTDGLINYVNVEKYAENLPSGISMAELAEFLGGEALEAGGADDITVIAARYGADLEKR